MTFTTALLKTPKVLPLESTGQQSAVRQVMVWRQNRLLITTASEVESAGQSIPALQNRQWFEACLKNSPVSSVRLDMALGEEALKVWADACALTGKRAYVHLPTATYLPRLRLPKAWLIKRVTDWVAAALITLLLSPVLLLLAAIVSVESSGPVFFRQWRVGHRGQLFQIIKFRTMRSDAKKLHHQGISEQVGLHKLENDPRVTRSGRWLRKYNLDELPQLFNVLLGEMSLVGPRPLALYDAMRISSTTQKRLNALPGMTGHWQVAMRSNQRNLEMVSRVDIDYLQRWSLLEDLRILILTLPKVVKGFGAF